MEVSEQARKTLDSKVNSILSKIDVPESLRNEIRKELTSNYTDAAVMHAQARGVSVVDKSDVESACETSETPEEIASMYMASYAKSLHRSGLLSRAIAYVIDMFFVNIFAFIATFPFMIIKFVLEPANQMDISKIHAVSMLLQAFYLIVIVNLTITFIYFVICEGFFSRTPGKWLLGLKVLRSDGKKASYREAMLRSIPKLFIFAILADAVLMELLYRKDRQRLFDKIAGTIVISRNKK